MTFEPMKNFNITSDRCKNLTHTFPNSLITCIVNGFPALVEPEYYDTMKKIVLLLEKRYLIAMIGVLLRESSASTICIPPGVYFIASEINTFGCRL